MSNMEFCVVSMTTQHLAEVVSIEVRCFASPWTDKMFENDLKLESARYFVALGGGEVIGYAGMWCVLDEAQITNVAVEPEYRRFGVGSALIGKLLEVCGKEDITTVFLEVRSSNTAAQELYGKFGFEVQGVRRGYYGDNGEDAIVMVRKQK